MKASSLTSALVVRKGTALPSAATPQPFGGRPAVQAGQANQPGHMNGGQSTLPTVIPASKVQAASAAFGLRKATAAAPVHVLRDSREAPIRPAQPSALPVATNGAAAARRRNSTGGSGGAGERPGGTAARVRMTLRMDACDHLRLKLAAAHSGKNMTRIIDEAIDSYLSDMGPRVNGGHCPCLAPRGPGRNDGDDAA